MSKFDLGCISITADVANKMDTDKDFCHYVSVSIARHENGDWGNLCKTDKQMNDEAVRTGDDRIFSCYESADHPDWRIWIITEWDRSATTVLFPDEY